MSIHFHLFKVEGTGAFPIDMLRRDECYPRSTEDAAGIAAEAPAQRVVTLCHVDSRPLFSWSPTAERWESFGWRVIEWNGVSTAKAIA